MEHVDPVLTAVCADIARQADRVAQLQAALTAARGIGPENGGQGEREKAALVASLLKTAGVTGITRLDAPDSRAAGGTRPNMVARIPGKSARTLWLFAHMDVVPPGDLAAWKGDPWQVRREGDLLYGRGVEDNQQAIASMLLLAEAIKTAKARPPLSLGLVFMADEENGSRYGLRHILEIKPEIFSPDDIYVVPDAGSPEADIVEVAEKGQLWLKVETLGAQCHASAPDRGKNAFLAASDLAVSLHAGLTETFTGKNALFSPETSTFTPTRHENNVDGINILPGRDVFYMDCRLLPGLSREDVLARARGIAAQVAHRHGVNVDIAVVHSQEATATPADNPGAAALREAVAAVYGVTPRPIGIGGATVAAFLRERGLPALVWACIRNTCHQPDEFSSIAATCKDAQVFARMLWIGHA